MGLEREGEIEFAGPYRVRGPSWGLQLNRGFQDLAERKLDKAEKVRQITHNDVTQDGAT